MCGPAAQRYRAATPPIAFMTAHNVRLLRTTLAPPCSPHSLDFKMVVMHPADYVATQQKHRVLLATWIMLLIIVPVIAVTLFFLPGSTGRPTTRRLTTLNSGIRLAWRS
jgi:heme/copper-type cytochrome/quinol oxidase subunit 2